MSKNKISMYDSKLREGIAEKIARLIASRAAKRAIEKAKRLAPDDESVKAELESLRQTHERLNKLLDTFCRRNPNDPECKDKTIRWR